MLKKSKADNKTLFITLRPNSAVVVARTSSRLPQQKFLGASTARVGVNHFTRLVDNEALAENDYHIAVASYAEVEDAREKIDITEFSAGIPGSSNGRRN